MIKINETQMQQLLDFVYKQLEWYRINTIVNQATSLYFKEYNSKLKKKRKTLNRQRQNFIEKCCKEFKQKYPNGYIVRTKKRVNIRDRKTGELLEFKPIPKTISLFPCDYEYSFKLCDLLGLPENLEEEIKKLYKEGDVESIAFFILKRKYGTFIYEYDNWKEVI